ncbi:MAG: hypothetical protein QM703_22740 [Gemmatales bacterium]
MSATTFVAGYGGTVTVNAGAMQVTGWDATRTVSVLDGTHSGSSGNFVPVKGAPFKVVVNVKANHDTAKMPLTFKEGDWATAILKHGSSSKNLTVDGVVGSIKDSNSETGFCSYDFTIEGSVTTYVA